VEEWLDDNKHLIGTIAMCVLVVQVGNRHHDLSFASYETKINIKSCCNVPRVIDYPVRQLQLFYFPAYGTI
jgi:hypothetical protein